MNATKADLVRPFAGLRAAADKAAEIAAPPYDVVTVEEARARAAGRPLSFLRVSRAEIDLPPGVDPYADEVYESAGRRLREFEAAGALVRDPSPRYYVYRMTGGGRARTGLVAAASLAAYDDGRVRRHELTRPDKVRDRARQIAATGAVTGPVQIVHRAAPRLAELLGRAAEGASDAAVPDLDGIRHELWTVADDGAVAEISAAVEAVDALYIADGHHRSAAAANLRETSGGGGPEGFLAVCFPADEVTILGYDRVVKDLGGRTPDEFAANLVEAFDVRPADAPFRPDAPGAFGMCLAGDWFLLEPRTPVSGGNPVDRLDVSVLGDRVLEPLLGIGDLRTDPRIDFVGGERGVEDIGARVASGEAAAGFTMFPTGMDDLMAIADAGLVMPPKSTWFDPKLADGLISQPLD